MADDYLNTVKLSNAGKD